MAHLTLIDLTFGQERTAIWYQYHEPGATPTEPNVKSIKVRWANINFLWYNSWYASTPSPTAPNQSQNNSWSKEQILMAVGIISSCTRRPQECEAPHFGLNWYQPACFVWMKDCVNLSFNTRVGDDPHSPLSDGLQQEVMITVKYQCPVGLQSTRQ